MEEASKKSDDSAPPTPKGQGDPEPSATDRSATDDDAYSDEGWETEEEK